MKNLLINLKSFARMRARTLLTLLCLLTLGVGQMWADSNVYNCYFTYNDGSDHSQNQDASGMADKDLGTLSSNLTIKAVYLKVWDDSYNGTGRLLNDGQLCYSFDNFSNTSYVGSGSWTQSSKDGNNYELQKSSVTWTLARTTDASGSYTLKYYWQVWGDGDKYLNNSGNNYQFTYKILPPALEDDDFTVTPSNLISGTGEEDDPFIIANNSSCTFTVSADQAHTDANSALWAKFGDGSYSSTLTSGSYAKSASKTSLTIKAKYRNDDASLDGTEVTKTIYYQEQPAGITIAAGSHGSVKKESGSWGSSAVYSPITLGSSYNIYAKADDYYDFSYWSSNNANSTIASSTSASTSISVSSGAVTTVTANFIEHPYTITIVGGTAANTTAKVVTTGSATANPPVGYYFTGWTVPGSNFTLVDCTTSDETITFNATANGTVTANFSRTYAFIEGRFQVVDASQTNWTLTSTSNGGWNDNQTYIPFEYDEDNNVFVLHTHCTPSKLSDNMYDNAPVFYIKKSTASGSLSNVTNYWSSSAQTLSAAGTANKRALVHTGDLVNYNLKFNSSTTSGYAVLYFDESYIWYELEQRLQYDGNGNTGGSAPSANNTYHKTGNTTTAATNTFTKTGYTFVGWATSKANADAGTKAYDEGDDITMSADVKLYAIWSEDEHAVSVVSSSATMGSVGDDEITGYYSTSQPLPTATANPGYHFVNWTVTSGTALITNATSYNSATINGMTDDVTVQANFESDWALYSSINSWGAANPLGNYSTVSTKDYGYVDVELAANTDYEFKIKYTSSGALYKPTSDSPTKITYANKATAQPMTRTVGGSPNQTIKTAAAGTYRFTWNITDHEIKVTYPTSWLVSMGVQTVYNTHEFGASQPDAEDPQNGDETGGTISVVDGSSNPITDGDYVVNGGSITLTATPAAGYKFAGWYKDASCTTPYIKNGVVDKTTPLTVSSLSKDTAYYAKFTERMTAVIVSNEGVGTIKVGGETAALSQYVGVNTHVTLVAEAGEGYYFARWEYADGEDNSSVSDASEDGATTTLSGAGLAEGYTSRLHAVFEPLDVIYFKNNLNWSNVYVYFNPSWDYAKDPSYSKGVYPLDAGCTCVAMTSGESIYHAYIPRKYSRPGSADLLARVAFSDVDMHTYTNFNNNNAVYRPDWNANLDMYVPAANGTGGATSIGTGATSFNSTTYYNEGYWCQRSPQVSTGISYYLKDNNGTYDEQFEAMATGAFMGKATIRIDATGNYKFYICSAAGTEYSNSSVTITNETTEAQTMYFYKDRGYFTVNVVAEGDYTFYLYQEGDHMTVKVDYPVSPGDYRLLYTYETSKTHASDPIKHNGMTQEETVSMYINPTDATASLKLQKCTSISAGKPVWSSGVSVGTLSSLFTVDVKGTPTPTKGVYVFNVSIDNENGTSGTELGNSAEVKSVTLSEIVPYTGKYYLKTDVAYGGWVNYTRNSMTKNTLNPTAFDYYFCKYLSSTSTNIRCVVANDYSHQISDTLKTDDILTRDATEYETLPEAASVRWSYNSKTNELKRTYLLGSSGSTSFLFIVPEDNMVYAEADGTTDLHDQGEDDSSRKFTDLGDWVYELEVKTYPTAQAGVQTKYPSFGTINRQTLIPTDNVLIGGDAKGATQYTVRLVYDFKTEYLMAAWTPSGDITTALKDIDVLLVRHGQDAGQTITFDGGSLKAKKIIGALEFRYNELVEDNTELNAELGVNYNQVSGNWTQETREKLMHFISFPFDVNVRDIFGIYGSYGWDWIVRKYNGAKRAKDGFFLGDGISTFWEDLTLDSVMHANEGYCVVLDNDWVATKYSNMWTNKGKGSSVYLYFPSSTTIGDVEANTDTIIHIPAHQCNYDRPFTNQHGQEVNHKFTDSHWNLMGVPLFTNQSGTESGTPGAVFVGEVDYENNPFKYYFAWNTEDNTYAIANAAEKTFKTMHSYMVQYTGDIKFTGSVPVPASVAARKAPMQGNYKLELQVLNIDEKVLNHTYVELRENACDTFALNEDVYMSPNSRAVNIYTLAGNYDVAANVLSISDHVVPVGLNVKKAGTYTFAMPNNFSGTVTLIDTYTETRTNLAMGDYTVNLPKGVNNERFLLEININNAPTAIDGVTDGSGTLRDGKAHKFIMNGQMYILKNGELFDATGRRVK